MSHSLKDILPEQIKKLNVTVAQFERMSGLNRNTVQNILRGITLHPSLDTVQKIANTLQCDLNDLIHNNVPTIEKHNNMLKKQFNMSSIIVNHELMNEIVSYVLNELKQRNINPKAAELYNSISEIYNYCIGEDKIAFDKKFSDWILSNYFYNNSQNS